ncbi:flagellar hook-basal body complex protein FliE (plasmid) [Citricoccus nitrophenolicus]
MPIEALGALNAAPAVTPTAMSLPASTSDATTTDGVSFASLLGSEVDGLQAMQGNRDALTLQAVTGDLQDVHDATTAAAKASTQMDLMVALRNSGLQAFNELMRIQA